MNADDRRQYDEANAAFGKRIDKIGEQVRRSSKRALQAIVLMSAVTVLGTVAILVSFHRQDNDRHRGRGQFCALVIRRYDADVQNYRDTLAYLKSLPANEQGQSLNKAIRKALPKTRATILLDRPPAICNEFR